MSDDNETSAQTEDNAHQTLFALIGRIHEMAYASDAGLTMRICVTDVELWCDRTGAYCRLRLDLERLRATGWRDAVHWSFACGVESTLWFVEHVIPWLHGYSRAGDAQDTQPRPEMNALIAARNHGAVVERQRCADIAAQVFEHAAYEARRAELKENKDRAQFYRAVSLESLEIKAQIDHGAIVHRHTATEQGTRLVLSTGEILNVCGSSREGGGFMSARAVCWSENYRHEEWGDCFDEALMGIIVQLSVHNQRVVEIRAKGEMTTAESITDVLMRDDR